VRLPLLASGDAAGFAACCRYIGGGRVTRIDREIAFTPDNWNLSFINSNRFNVGPWMANTPLRHRLPLFWWPCQSSRSREGTHGRAHAHASCLLLLLAPLLRADSR